MSDGTRLGRDADRAYNGEMGRLSASLPGDLVEHARDTLDEWFGRYITLEGVVGQRQVRVERMEDPEEQRNTILFRVEEGDDVAPRYFKLAVDIEEVEEPE